MLIKMNSIVFVTLFVIVSYQVIGSQSADERQPKFGFGIYEMIQKEFCKDICNRPFATNRTSRTILLCFIKCSRPQTSTNGTSSSKPAGPTTSSIIMVGTTKGNVDVFPPDATTILSSEVSSRVPGRRLRPLPSTNPQASLHPALELLIKDGNEQNFERNLTSLSALNISLPISIEAFVLNKLRENYSTNMK